MAILRKYFIGLLGLCVILVLSAGCGSTQYGDAGNVPVYDTDFGATDLQQIAAKMTTSLLTFPPIVQITDERRPRSEEHTSELQSH